MKYLLTIISTIIGVFFLGKKFIPDIEENNDKTKRQVEELDNKIQSNHQNISVEEQAQEKMKQEMQNAKQDDHSISDNVDFFNKR
jgi:chorismate synthase